MLKDKKITIIGAGNMGGAIALGLANSGIIDAKNITTSDKDTEKLKAFADVGISITTSNLEAVDNADIVIVAVKPWFVDPVLKEISAVLQSSKQTLASVVAGYSLQQMKDATGLTMPMFRVMPNTAIAIQQSMTFVSGNGISKEAEEEINYIFRQLGESIAIEEHLQQAATVLGSSGIAFAMRYIRASMQAGLQMGFGAEIAKQISAQTVKGAAELLLASGEHPEQEIDRVSTPKGYTITGLNAMEQNGFSASLIKGILEAYRL